jgi:hypothetical protein
MNDTPEQLEETVRRHDEELHEAVAKLREATKRPLGLADRIRDDPLPWLAGGLLVGLWVGSRRG